MNTSVYNRMAWDHEVEIHGMYASPIEHDLFVKMCEAKEMPLTPQKNVPSKWLEAIKNKKVLCLAASGGQQAPLLAGMGAEVTSFDLSEKQLELDQQVANREGLKIRTVQGDMQDLGVFPSEAFDLIFHAVSNCFVESIHTVWSECARVLRPGGVLIAGMINPVNYIFDADLLSEYDELKVRYSIPYSDLRDLDKSRLAEYKRMLAPLEFGHSLEMQIGGQLKSGFILVDFYEDTGPNQDALDRCIPTFFATRAVKASVDSL